MADEVNENDTCCGADELRKEETDGTGGISPPLSRKDVEMVRDL